MKILEVRRLAANERGSTCEITTGRGSGCNYTARRVVELESESGRNSALCVCRIHLRMITSASPAELNELILSPPEVIK